MSATSLVEVVPDDGYDYTEPPREPINPTDAKPGSRAKKLVMRERVKNGESPFHPDDPSILPGSRDD